MFRKTILALVLTASGLVHAQVPISGLPPATLPLQPTDQVIVNQTVSGTVKSTRAAPVSAITGLIPPLSASYLLRSSNASLPQSRVLVGTANEILLADGGPLGNLVLSTPQPICTTCGPTFSSLTLTGVLNGLSGVFSSTLSSAGYTGTTGSFSGALSAGSFSLTTPLPATSGGTGFGTYTVGDILAANATTTLSKVVDVTAGSYLRSGGASTLPLYSTVKIPNTDALGDLWVGSAANTMTALGGNITTATQWLSQTGTGTVSASPAWSALPGSFSGFANPTGLIGLTAANGAATTATRSDATHAIDQSITPSWSGQHIFTGVFTSTGTAGNSPIALRSTQPGMSFSATGQALDSKVWDAFITTQHFTIQIDNDAGTVSKGVLDFLRSANTVASMTLGNIIDKPTIALVGPTQSYEGSFGTTALKNVATYDSGTFVGTVTGMTAATTGTVNWTRTGNIATVYVINSITGTSNTTAMSLTGLPSQINPTNAQKVACTGITDNNVGDSATQCFILNTNQIAFSLLNVTNGKYTNTFTASATKGLTGAFSVTYSLQ